jgi:hypothetical protein
MCSVAAASRVRVWPVTLAITLQEGNMTVKQIGKRCLVSAALLALFVVYGPDATPVSGDPTKDVVVTNTSANPVPVTGSISASGTVQAAQSGTWTVRMPTHLGVPTTELVALEYHNISTGFSGCTNDDTICSNPQRILPDGGRGAFSIPAGKMLVITDIKWTATAGDAGDEVGVRAANLGYTSSARFDGLGRAAFSEHFTSGIVVSIVPTFVFTHHEGDELGFLIVRGYLAPA